MLSVVIADIFSLKHTQTPGARDRHERIISLLGGVRMTEPLIVRSVGGGIVHVV